MVGDQTQWVFALRILHVIPSFVGGGAERQLSLLAPELCRLGVEIHVAYLHPGVNLTPLLESSITLHRIACSNNHDPRIFLRLLQVVRTIKPDLIQTWLPQMDIFGGVVARLVGIPFVLSERASALAYRGCWKIWLRRFVGRGATAIVANSKSGLDYWRESASECRVIRNGLSLISTSTTTPANPRVFGLPEDACLILFAGRLNEQKNIPTLLDALEVVLESRPECAALLFGDGSLHGAVVARIERMPMRDRVRLLGYTDKLWCWMRRASVFVSVSRFEGNPNVVLEAMAIGCPLVVSDIPEYREILDETSAQLCDGGSAPDIAAAILAVLENSSAAESRAVLACRRAADWSIEASARQYLGLYETLIFPGKTSI